MRKCSRFHAHAHQRFEKATSQFPRATLDSPKLTLHSQITHAAHLTIPKGPLHSMYLEVTKSSEYTESSDIKTHEHLT